MTLEFTELPAAALTTFGLMTRVSVTTRPLAVPTGSVSMVAPFLVALPCPAKEDELPGEPVMVYAHSKIVMVSFVDAVVVPYTKTCGMDGAMVWVALEWFVTSSVNVNESKLFMVRGDALSEIPTPTRFQV